MAYFKSRICALILASTNWLEFWTNYCPGPGYSKQGFQFLIHFSLTRYDMGFSKLLSLIYNLALTAFKLSRKISSGNALSKEENQPGESETLDYI